jgi:hypothetical protein
LALEQEKLRQKAVEPPPVARKTYREELAKCWSEWLMIRSDRCVALRQDVSGRWIIVDSTDPDKIRLERIGLGGDRGTRATLYFQSCGKRYAEEFGFIVTGLVKVVTD